MYIALSTAELFSFAEATKELTKLIRLQETFGFINIDDETSWRLARVEELIQRFIGEDSSDALETEVHYYNGE